MCHYITLQRTLTGVLLYEPHTHQLVLMVLLEHKNEQYTNIYKVTGTSGATKRYSYMRFVGCFFFLFVFVQRVGVPGRVPPPAVPPLTNGIKIKQLSGGKSVK